MLDLSTTTVLVTGGTGFLGSRVVRELEHRGAAKVIAASSKDADLTDPALTRKYLEHTKPDVIMHLAAKVGGIGANQRYPGTFFRDNMAMGLNVLETARLLGTSKVVIAGTICAYPKFTPVPFKEDDLWNGYPEETNAPYGIAKKALLVMAQAYRAEFGSNFVMLFPVNLYGPGDNFDLETSHVIPAMIRKFVEAKAGGVERVEMWGDGSPSREFLYVDDCARGLVDAAERYDGVEPVNLGCGQEITMRALAAKIGEKVGFSGAIHWNTSRPNGQPRRMLDVSRARLSFGFEATTSLDAGLDTTIAWFSQNHSRPAQL
jgi:GDP-L-fucose synthase